MPRPAGGGGLRGRCPWWRAAFAESHGPRLGGSLALPETHGRQAPFESRSRRRGINAVPAGCVAVLRRVAPCCAVLRQVLPGCWVVRQNVPRGTFLIFDHTAS